MKALNKYTIRALQYQHLDDSSLIRDFREKKSATAVMKDMYYVGYEIRTADQIIYHHATVLADTEDGMFDGIAEVHNSLLPKFPRPRKLTLVYLRNYLSIDRELFDDGIQDMLREEVENLTAKRKLDHFIAYGMLGDDVIACLECDVSNAIDMLGKILANVRKNYSEDPFTFLWACPAHPVAAEYNEHFDYAQDRIRMMIDDSGDWQSASVN